MDKFADPATAPVIFPARLPAWALPKGREASAPEAAFAAGIALNMLDDLVRSAPVWAGCWRGRQALFSATAAMRMLGRGEDEKALRDALVLTAPGDDPGPAGRVLLAFRRLGGRKPDFSAASLATLAGHLGFAPGDWLERIGDHVSDALAAGRPAPFAIADLISAIAGEHPEQELMAFLLADMLMARLLGWDHPVPLMMTSRFGPAFRISGGRGRVRPGEAGFPRAVALGLVEATERALRSAGEIARRADVLLAVAPKVRTKGGGGVISNLLEEDALGASAPGSGLSRWASARLFERLESLGGVRELSGRSSFRIYGL